MPKKREQSESAKELAARLYQVMWRQRVPQERIGELLDVGQGGVSNRLRGELPLSITEFFLIADELGISAGRLVAEVRGEMPGQAPQLKGTIEDYSADQAFLQAVAGRGGRWAPWDSNPQPAD